MTFGIGILNGITGTGRASDQLPAQQDIVAQYQNSVTADDKQWVDVNASGNYEVEEAESINIAPGKTIEFPTIGVGFSLTVNSGTSTCSFSGTTLSCSVGGSLFDFSLSDGSTTWTYSGGEGSDGTTLYANEADGPTGTLTGFTLPTDRVQSIEYGHEWENYSEDVPDNIELWDLPPTATGGGWSDNGDGTWTCDGTQSGSSLVTIGGGVLLPLGGSWGVTLTVLSVDDNSGRVSLASGDLTTPPADTAGVYDGSGILTTGGGNINLIAEVGFAGTVRPSWQSIVTGKIPADPTSPNLDILGNTLTNPGTPQKNIQVTGYAGTFDGTAYLTASHLTGSEIVVDSTGTSTPSVSAGKIDFTIGWCSFVELSNGDTYIIESNPASLQDTVYNIADTNHGILTSATLPFFTTEIEGSKLFADGFDNVGGSTGLVPARADGLSATGQPLTNQPTEFIGDYCLFDAPLSVSFYDAAVVAGIDTNLYLAGAAIGLTADAWILLASNPLFFGAVQNILVMYNDTQSGDTLDQINDYLGI